MSTIVQVKIKRGYVWPERCVCCNDSSDTVAEVSYTKHEGVLTKEYTHKIPVCRICAKHRGRVVSGSGAGSALLIILGALISIGVGSSADPVAGFLFFVLWVISIALIISQIDKRAQSDAKAMMNSTCSGADFISFYRAQKAFSVSGVDVFTFANDQYAKDFCKSNSGEFVAP